MAPSEYREARQCRGTWKAVAAALGEDWRTVARREAGLIKVTDTARASLLALPIVWLKLMPPLPSVKEEIRRVPGFAGYAVTESGRVFSCHSKYPTKEFPYKKWAEISATKGIRGYWVVALVAGGKRRQLKLHQVVLLGFVGPPKKDQQGCHWDDDPDNNHIGNLRWGSAKENRADLLRNERNADRKGMKHPLAKLTELDVLAIRRRRELGDTLKTIAATFSVSEGMVSLICSRKSWSHI